jgi:hypothetical protein
MTGRRRLGNGVHNAEGPSQSVLGGLGDMARFAASDTFEAAEAQAVVCTVGRPGNTDYFRTQPDRAWWRDFYFLEYTNSSGQRQLYLVDPALGGLPELEGQVRRRRLIPYMTLRGGLGIWPVGIEASDNHYVSSALRICDQATDKWCLAVSVRELGQYKVKIAQGEHPDPRWPDLDLGALLEMAFPADKRITTADHPILARLRGE